MPVPDFILHLRQRIGHDLLWLPGVTAVVLDQADRVLLVRRSDNGAWTPVTGIVDPGEHPAHAAVREVREETGTVCAIEALVWINVTEPITHTNGDHAQYLDHTFRCRYVSGDPYPADDESTAVAWYPTSDLPPMSPIMRERIVTAIRNEGPTRLV